MTSPQDYNQRFHAYLQAWQQVLEPLAAMTAALPLPATPWAMPAMPPYASSAPPVPPAPPRLPPLSPMPNDYTQQLFGYLQGWRQYLEQMAGAQPAPAQPSGPQPSGAQTSAYEGIQPHEGGSAQTSRPDQWVPVSFPPGDTGGTETTLTGLASSSGATSPKPTLVPQQPANPGGNQQPDDSRKPISPLLPDQSLHVPFELERQAARLARGPQVDTAPPVEFGPRVTNTGRSFRRGAQEQVQRPAGTPATAARLTVPAEPLVARTSRFKGLAERAAGNRNLG